MYKWLKVIIIIIGVGILLGGCSSNIEESEDVIEVTQVVEEEAPTAADTSPSEQPTSIIETSIAPTDEPTSISESDLTVFPLPERSGPRAETTGTVPHVQINVPPITEEVSAELFRRAYALPGVEDRPTVVSLPGARGMWLSDEIEVVNPQAIVNGREFAHIHPDGSLHAPLPYDRALEVAEKGWGERHPWADERDGWEGFVMLFTPQSMDELDITFQLIVESYNHVTGQTVEASTVIETAPPLEEEEPKNLKLNLNEATEEEYLTAIPNFSERMAYEFLEYRPYISIQEFRREIGKYVSDEAVEYLEEFVYVPININESDAESLMQIPGIDPNVADSLIDGRPYGNNGAFIAKLSEVAPNIDSNFAATFLTTE